MDEALLKESLAALLRSVRERVEETRRGELALIRLAALLWAACVFVYERGGVRQAIAGRKPKPVRSLEQAGRVLAELEGEPDATRSYRTFVDVLVFLDAEIDPNVFDESRDGRIPLESLQGDPPVLQGTVQAWVRQPTLLRRLRRKGGREMRYLAEPDRHLGALTFYLPSFDRPDLILRPARIDEDLYAWQPLVYRSAVLAEEGALRIALCPLQGPWRPQFRLVDGEGEEGPSFVAFPKIKEDEERSLLQHLDSILEQVRRRKVHILIFPELSVDAEMRALLQERLKHPSRSNPLLAVFAGSFHVGEPVPYNEAVVWDGRGRPLWSHRKRGRFRLQPYQVTKIFFPDLESPPEVEVWEGIVQGTELVVADTGLGRLALLICADALEPERDYPELIGRAHPDLVVIVAMSHKTADFEEVRKRLVKQNIGVLLVNAACMCVPGGDSADLVLVDLSLHESAGRPPTRWKWRLGFEPEWYRYQRPEKDAGAAAGAQARSGGEIPWRSRAELPAKADQEPGVEILDGGAGFVLNLGAYLYGSDENS